MILTEKEAKKKWCPMVWVGDGDCAENRNCISGEVERHPGKGVQWNCCIASDCMLWDWAEGNTPGNQQIPMKGFCGLGGAK